MKITD